MKVILSSLNSRYIHSNLAIRYLKASQRERNIEVHEYTINENPLKIALSIIEKRPEVVAFSCYIWNIENTMKVCSTIKEMDRRIIIVLGGPEVSFDSRDMIREYEYIDYIVKGEGEIAFGKLLDCLEFNKEEIKNIPGLLYRFGEEIRDNGECSIIGDLNEIPFPYQDEIPERIVYYESSRGCPYNCSYCMSSTIKGVRYLDLERVKRELKLFIDNNTKLVKFVDRTFNASRKYAMEIWNYLIKNSSNTSFHFEIAADILDDEAIGLLSQAPDGLFQFEIGIQTTNPGVLRNINRNMDFARVRENVIKLLDNGNIHCHLDIIVGLPGEDMESLKKSFDDCMDIKPHMLQIGFLKVLKGAPVYYEKDKFGIHNAAYPPYQVLYTEQIPVDDMQRLIRMEDVFEHYYNSGILKITLDYVLSHEQSEFDFFMDFSDFLMQKGFYSRNFDLKDKFKALYDYVSTDMNIIIIKDLMLHDFLISTKKSWIPDFLKRQFYDNIKEKVDKEKEQIANCLGQSDFKKILYMPVNIRVNHDKTGYRIEENEGLLVIDLQSSEYCYI